MLRLIFSIIMLFSLTNTIICQSDCPGGVAAPLDPGSYTWYWDETLDGALFSRTAALVDLDNPTKIQIVRSAITSALSQWTSATDQVITFSEGDENEHDLEIVFTAMGSNEWGSAPSSSLININSDKTWTDYTSLVEPTYYWPDIKTVMLHEMGHIFGLTHASPTSTSVMWYNNYDVRRSLTSCDESTVNGRRNLYSSIRSTT